MFASMKKSAWFDSNNEAPIISQNLVEIGGDLSVPRLLRGYQSGNFPWTADPVTWWSPDPRTVIEFDDFHVSRSLRRLLRKNIFEVTIDKAFAHVIRTCAASGKGRRSTWITPE